MPNRQSPPSRPSSPAAAEQDTSVSADAQQRPGDQAEKRETDRPTLEAKEISQELALQTLLEPNPGVPEALGSAPDRERASQVPTVEPPPPSASSSSHQAVPAAGYTIHPPPGKSGALDFVDGHSRESEQPAPIAFSEPVKAGPKIELDPGASLSDLYAVGNFTDAMREAEARLELDPDDEDAMRYADECRRTLTTMYTARLGPAGSVLKVAARTEEMRWMSLDHRAGFMLSLIDGKSTLDDILDICGMKRLDALTILVELHDKGILRIAPHNA